MLDSFSYNSIIKEEIDITYVNPYVEDLLDDLLNYNDLDVEEKQNKFNELKNNVNQKQKEINQTNNEINLILQGIIKK